MKPELKRWALLANIRTARNASRTFRRLRAHGANQYAVAAAQLRDRAMLSARKVRSL